MKLEPEISALISQKMPKLAGTVNGQSMQLGLTHGEPLLAILNSCMRYAKAYKKRFEQPISDDGYAADSFRAILDSCKILLDMDGAVAWEKGITTDSKDNGLYEDIYWLIIKAADYSEE